MKFKNKLNMEELVQKIEDAPTEEKSQAIVEAIQKALDVQKEDVVKEYREMYAEVQSNKEMADRFGLRTLNNEEKEFYQKVTKGFYDGTEREAVLPETTLNYIFEDLRRSRPLFQYIDFSPAGLKEMLVSEYSGKAVWGDIEDKIAGEIKGQIESVKLDTAKLTAFTFIPNSIIDLGYEWVDRYIREVLIEVLAEGLEEGFIAGDGKNKPIGLIRKLSGSTDGVYPEREAVKIEDFTPASLGKELATLTDEGRRILSKLILIVNPIDNYTKVKPATTFLNANGEYREVFPVNIEVEEAVSVPEGKAILYIPNAYKAGLSELGVEHSDEYKFLDHTRTYRVVAYGDGRLKKENMAAYLDISDLKPLAFNVNTPDGKTVEGA